MRRLVVALALLVSVALPAGAGAGQPAELPPGDLYNHIVGVETQDGEPSNAYRREGFGAVDPSRPDSQVASPFTVPAGVVWNLTGARVKGFLDDAEGLYSLGTVVNVFIYRNQPPGTVGPVVYQALGVNATIPEGEDPDDLRNYEVTLPGVKLDPGEYWFSMQQTDAWHTNGIGGEHIHWIWNEEVGEQQSRGIGTRAGTPAATPALFALSGTTGALPGNPDPTPRSKCGTVKPDADNFTPRKPKVPTRLGVRAKLISKVPADFTITASLKSFGKITKLGTFEKLVTSYRKVRIPIPARALGLRRLDRVVLFMRVQIRPRGSGTCEAVTKKFKMTRTVFNIERALADL
jgi:hypothetical protein